jgi:Leucine-rich repeat (LRR) protein
MANLQTLDLSNNKIADLRSSGIEQCNNLARINLKHNLITKVNRCVPTLAQVGKGERGRKRDERNGKEEKQAGLSYEQVCALLTVYLEGNQVVLKKNFRSR